MTLYYHIRNILTTANRIIASIVVDGIGDMVENGTNLCYPVSHKLAFINALTLDKQRRVTNLY